MIFFFDMSTFLPSRYEVDRLVEARKIAMRVKINTLEFDPKADERAIKVDIRRIDSKTVDLSLEFYGRVNAKGLPGVGSIQKPSGSLLWRAKRIRGLDHKISHPVLENGLIKGSIKGWHEHYWTDSDQDHSIRIPDPIPKNQDLRSIVQWCSTRWNIENIDHQMRFDDE